jgi:hypothetical protein
VGNVSARNISSKGEEAGGAATGKTTATGLWVAGRTASREQQDEEDQQGED